MPTIVNIVCKQCQTSFAVAFKNRKRKFCSRECVNKFQTGSGNPSYGKTYRTKETHPEWAKKVSETHRDRGSIQGDKNPMKNPAIAKRMGKSRSDRLKNDPELRKKISEATAIAWKEGKFDSVAVGRCKWFEHTRKDGYVCKVQGTWELAYAKWLDSQGIPYDSHRGVIPYTDGRGIKRSYLPDFYLPDTNEFIEIKNRYHYELQKEKWKYIRDCNPDLKIRILFKDDLIKMGVEI